MASSYNGCRVVFVCSGRTAGSTRRHTSSASCWERTRRRTLSEALPPPPAMQRRAAATSSWRPTTVSTPTPVCCSTHLTSKMNAFWHYIIVCVCVLECRQCGADGARGPLLAADLQVPRPSGREHLARLSKRRTRQWHHSSTGSILLCICLNTRVHHWNR